MRPVSVKGIVLLALATALTVTAALAGDALGAGLAAFAAVLTLNYAPLRRAVGSRVVSRTLRAVPLVAPLASVGLPAAPGAPAWAWAACLVPVVGWLAITSGRIALNLRAARLAPAVTGAERVAGMLPFALAGPAQEYLHRGVLLTSLTAALGPFAIPLTAATFVAEHVFTARRRGRATVRELCVWTGMSLLFGAVVYVEPGALLAAVAGHTLFNLPHVIAWLLRHRRNGAVRGLRPAGAAGASRPAPGDISPEQAERIARVQAGVRRRLAEIPGVAAAVLAGSVIDGYGNPNSDIDLTVLAHAPAERGFKHDRAELVVHFDGKMIEVSFVEGERLDLEIHPLAKVQGLIETLRRYRPGDRRPHDFDPFSFQLLHQLRIGVVVAGGQELDRIRAEVPWEMVTELMRQRNESSYIGHAEDAAGAIKAGDAPTAVLASRRALGAATDCLIAAYGHTNPKEKWRYRKLDDLGLSELKDRCLAAECDPDPQAFLTGARRRLLLAQELVALAGQRGATA